VFLVIILLSLALDGTFAIPRWWYIGLSAIFITVVAAGVSVLSLSFFVPVKSKGTADDRVALTFDDGPVPGKTDQVLRILKEFNVPAAFFCIGNRVDKYPEMVRRMDQEGHIVGNHTYWHGKFFDLKSAPMVTRELYDTDVAICNAIGKKPKMFRPPYGVTNPMIARAVKRLNHSVIGWSIRSFDTMISNPDKLLQRVTDRLKGGDVVLLHDFSPATIAALPEIISHIKKRGLKIVRLDELIKEKPYGE
jgi:peptidoglycan/xylan/chitin deacetylase (PgdA/CDA1 family)